MGYKSSIAFVGYQGIRLNYSAHKLLEQDLALITLASPEYFWIMLPKDLVNDFIKDCYDYGYAATIDSHGSDNYSTVMLTYPDDGMTFGDKIKHIITIAEKHTRKPISLDNPYYDGTSQGIRLASLLSGDAINNANPETRNWIELLDLGRGYGSYEPDTIRAKANLIKQIIAEDLVHFNGTIKIDHFNGIKIDDFLSLITSGIIGISQNLLSTLGRTFTPLPEGWPNTEQWAQLTRYLPNPHSLKEDEIHLIDQDNLRQLAEPLLNHLEKSGGSIRAFADLDALTARMRHVSGFRDLDPTQQAWVTQALGEKMIEINAYARAENYLNTVALLKVLPVAALQTILDKKIAFFGTDLEKIGGLFTHPILKLLYSFRRVSGLYLKMKEDYKQYIIAKQSGWSGDGEATALHEVMHMLLDYMPEEKKRPLLEEAEQFIAKVSRLEDLLETFRDQVRQRLMEEMPDGAYRPIHELKKDIDAIADRIFTTQETKILWENGGVFGGNGISLAFDPSMGTSVSDILDSVSNMTIYYHGDQLIANALRHARQKSYEDTQRPEEFLCELMAHWVVETAHTVQQHPDRLTHDLSLAMIAGMPLSRVLQNFLDDMKKPFPTLALLPQTLQYFCELILPETMVNALQQEQSTATPNVERY